MSQLDAELQESTECPSCDRGFDSVKGMKIHHAQAHGESIANVERECQYCGDTFEAPPAEVKRGGARYCSHVCAGIDATPGETVSRECESCGDDFTARKARVDNGGAIYCSYECHHGERRVGMVPRECPQCGEGFSVKKSQLDHRPAKYCSQECAGQAHRGEKHYNWKGGGQFYYGPNWEEQREKARERDNYECQVCGSGNIHVHHIRPLREFDNHEYGKANALRNLICLCPAHHKRWEGIPIRPQTG